MDFSSQHLYAVIMAGGRGERFWPLGRRKRPKQLLALSGERSMIEETVLRLFPLLPAEHVFVLTNDSCVDAVRELLPIPSENVFGEPTGRDTAPCIALASALIGRLDPEATLVVLPADHIVRPAKAFQQVLLAAARRARTGELITLGVSPDGPATGYGYIHLGEAAGEGFRHVLEFTEKPDPETAERFLRSGDYRWNSGIFIWRVDAIIAAFRRYCPPLAEKIDGWLAGADYRADFAECQKISIDYAVLEKAENILVGEAPFDWNDIGNWSSLRSVLPLDDSGNAFCGNVLAVDSGENVLISDSETLVGVIGMHGIAVVKSGNGVLVCPLNREQHVRELVQKIRLREPSFL